MYKGEMRASTHKPHPFADLINVLFQFVSADTTCLKFHSLDRIDLNSSLQSVAELLHSLPALTGQLQLSRTHLNEFFLPPCSISCVNLPHGCCMVRGPSVA